MPNSVSILLVSLTVILYFASWLRSLRQSGASELPQAWIQRPNVLMAAGLVVHTVFLAYYGIQHHRAPLVLFSEAMLFLSWSIVVVFFLINFSISVPTLSKYVTPILVVIFALAIAHLSRNEDDVPEIKGWLVVHIVSVLFAVSLFFLNFISGVLYLVKEKWLKERRTGGVMRKIPPLELLVKLNIRTLMIGFPLLTFGMFLGVIFVRNVDPPVHWQTDRTVLFGLSSWLLYALVLHLRLVSSYQGRRVMILTVLSFVYLVATFIGVNLIMTGNLHSFTGQ